MAYTTGTATSNQNLIDQVIRYVCGYGTTGSVTYSGTGNGTLTLGGTYPSAGTFPATVSETWTVTCTAAAANGGTFSVVGSVSGAQASATVGVAYANSRVAFTIADGAADFQIGDAFTFTTTQGAMKAAAIEWEYLGRGSGQTTGGWVRGKGLTGSESIYVGMQTADTPGSDIYNIEIAGSSGFNSAFAFSGQVGKSPVSYVGGWNTTTPFWIVANAQRFVVVSKVSTTYHAMYCGKILPYGTPSQYGYPVFIGGETNQTTYRWSNVTTEYRHFTDPGGSASPSANSAANLCHPDGTWYAYFNFYWNGTSEQSSSIGRHMWPYAGDNGDSYGVQTFLRELRDNIDGSYSLLPLILNTDAPGRHVFGELDGCYYVSGHNNASENIITIDGVDHLVVQNIFRTNRFNYWALKLQ